MDGGERGPDEPLELLRAKYLDYCSAQIADLLVYLTPDEIYLIAHRVRADADVDRGLGYQEMVRVATDWLAHRVALPPFDVWVEDYARNPAQYDEYLMGLWRLEDEPASPPLTTVKERGAEPLRGGRRAT